MVTIMPVFKIAIIRVLSITVITAILLILFRFGSAKATVAGAPGIKECEGASGFQTSTAFGGFCWWSPQALSDGLNYVKNATYIVPPGSFMFTGYWDFYVPYDGNWALRYYFCPATSEKNCSLSETIGYYDSAYIHFNNQQTIDDQSPSFSGMSGNIPANSSICIAFVGQNNPSVPWGAASGLNCRGINILPSTPAVCYINGNTDLNVSLGSLERQKIPSTPMQGSPGNVKKSISVLCTAEGKVDVVTRFNFTPISINGSEVVSTSAAGLGVAMFYKDKLVTPLTTLNESYSNGTTPIEIEFQAVRDPNSVIPTGDFFANIIMIMTQQ
ncbi:hypothetical protein [Lelliottia nimipressuralis]